MSGGTTHAGLACYVVTLADGTKSTLPIWMAEANAARGAEIRDVGVASLAALQELRGLVDEVREAWARSAASASEPTVSGDTP